MSSTGRSTNVLDLYTDPMRARQDLADVVVGRMEVVAVDLGGREAIVTPLR